jgi:hypothetical protein
MPPMPFYLEKGPAFSIIEDYLNGSERRALATLATIRIPKGRAGFTELWDLPVFDPEALPRPPGMPSYRDDFRAKWCGYVERDGTWQEPDPDADDNIGIWLSYWGRVEAITRQTLRTALEISLGIARDDDVPERAEQHWPIDMYWKCGQNWFEGWVTWRRHERPEGAGHVNLIFATPADGSIVLDSPIDNRNLNKGPAYDPDFRSIRVPGTGEERRAGMVVVTHRCNQLDHWRPPSARKVEDGLEVPRYVSARFLGKEEIVVVAPSEADGGVLPTPRRYEGA